MHAIIRRLTTTSFLLLLFGCSKNPNESPGDSVNWLEGNYELDSNPEEKGEIKSTMVDDKGKQAAAALGGIIGAFETVGRYNNTTIRITQTDIATFRGGVEIGTVIDYEIYDILSPNRVRIKTSEGKIETWEKTETGVKATKGVGDGDHITFPVYFKRKA
ncbi:MAG: hypothetical protein KDN22_02865 [Verrucomicrobiae bacterium]|nr:hypothetical protein [Verrucomicrobiae bacterium]